MSKLLLNNPSFTTTLDVKGICDEYFGDLNINLHYFGHGAVYPDGRYYALISNPEWGKWHCIDQGLPPGGYTVYDQIKNSIQLPHLDSGDKMGWPDEAMYFAKERFGIENLMVIFRKYDDHIENFFFDLHDKRTHELYINNLDIFENFIFYFKDRARDLIKKATENPLITPKKYFNSDIHIQKSSLDEEKLIFDPEGIAQSNKPLPSQYYLNNLGNNYSISTREYQCLSLLAHGSKIKNIAQTLNISPRTIDTHLISLKRKLQAKTLIEAVEIYWRNRVLHP